MRRILFICFLVICYSTTLGQQKDPFYLKNEISFELDFLGNYLYFDGLHPDQNFNYFSWQVGTFKGATFRYKRNFYPFNDNKSLRLFSSLGYQPKYNPYYLSSRKHLHEIPLNFGLLMGRSHTLRTSIGYTAVFGKEVIQFKYQGKNHYFNYTYLTNFNLSYEYHFKNTPFATGIMIKKQFPNLRFGNKKIGGVKIRDIEDAPLTSYFQWVNPNPYSRYIDDYFYSIGIYIVCSYSF